MPKMIKIFLLLFISPILLSAQKINSKKITLYLPTVAEKVLVCEECNILYSSKNDLAEIIFNTLCKKANEPKYINLFSENSYVSQKDHHATVNISKKPGLGRIDDLTAEYLTIYSVVNSLTSSGDIITVDFTVGGKKQKDFYGYIDMRETFIPDYDICS